MATVKMLKCFSVAALLLSRGQNISGMGRREVRRLMGLGGGGEGCTRHRQDLSKGRSSEYKRKNFHKNTRNPHQALHLRMGVMVSLGSIPSN